MDTPHVTIVYYKGQYRIAQYGYYNGYPSGQGLAVLNFARDAQLMRNLKAALDADVLYEPSKEQMQEFKRQMPKEQEERIKPLLASRDVTQYVAGLTNDSEHPSNLICPSLDRLTGARILNVVASANLCERERMPIILELDCILWAGCGWVLDLDMGVLECWKRGHVRVFDGGLWELSTRFKYLQPRAQRRPTLMASFSLDDLPDDATFYMEGGTM